MLEPALQEAGTQEMAPNTQIDSPGASPVAPAPVKRLSLPRPAPWARLVGIGPTVDFGAFELHDRERPIVIGNARNTSATVRIDDPRVSSTHCKLFIDGHNQVQLLDESSNGTWLNNDRMAPQGQKGVFRPLKAFDTISVLHPKPPNLHEVEAPPHADASVVPRAINYQFLFLDLRAAQPPPMMPPPPQPAPPQLLRGTSLRGAEGYNGRPEDYVTLCELGRGAFAVVRKVRHLATGVEYAMKVMEKRKLLRGAMSGAPSSARRQQVEDEVKQKVLAEARILRTVSHPNIVSFVDIFETDAELFLVMELVEGGDLFDRLARGPMAEPDARAVMHQLLQAIKHLHARHIVHRDLKPENILLARHDAAGRSLPTIKIADFGLAKLVGVGGQAAATFCGTPQYFAPEVLESRNRRKGYDTACDLWSIGVLMYILLSGKPPFFDDGEEAAQQQQQPPLPPPDQAPPSHGGAPSAAAAAHHAPPPQQQLRHGRAMRTMYEKIQMGLCLDDFAYLGEEWDEITPAAKHMICSLLVVDPTRRLNVDAALSHPWMRGEVTVPPGLQPPPPPLPAEAPPADPPLGTERHLPAPIGHAESSSADFHGTRGGAPRAARARRRRRRRRHRWRRRRRRDRRMGRRRVRRGDVRRVVRPPAGRGGVPAAVQEAAPARLPPNDAVGAVDGADAVRHRAAAAPAPSATAAAAAAVRRPGRDDDDGGGGAAAVAAATVARQPEPCPASDDTSAAPVVAPPERHGDGAARSPERQAARERWRERRRQRCERRRCAQDCPCGERMSVRG